MSIKCFQLVKNFNTTIEEIIRRSVFRNNCMTPAFIGLDQQPMREESTVKDVISKDDQIWCRTPTMNGFAGEKLANVNFNWILQRSFMSQSSNMQPKRVVSEIIKKGKLELSLDEKESLWQNVALKELQPKQVFIDREHFDSLIDWITPIIERDLSNATKQPLDMFAINAFRTPSVTRRVFYFDEKTRGNEFFHGCSIRNLINNPLNWSVIFNFAEQVTALLNSKLNILNPKKLADFQAFIQFEMEKSLINKLDETHSFLVKSTCHTHPSFYPDLRTVKQSNILVQLVESLESYLNKKHANECKALSGTQTVIELLNIKFNNLEHRSLLDRDVLNSDECKRLEPQLNQLMKRFTSFDSVPKSYKNAFLFFFSFFKKKLEMLTKSKSDYIDAYGLILHGIVAQNYSLSDENLNEKFNEFLMMFFKSRLLENVDPGHFVLPLFTHFLSLAAQCNPNTQCNRFITKAQVEFVLKTCHDFDFIPTLELVLYLKSKLDPSSWSLVNTDIGQINLPAKTLIDKATRDRLADGIKINVLSLEDYLRDEKQVGFDIIDLIIQSNVNNFDYLIDGMNVYYRSRNSIQTHRVLMIDNLIEVLGQLEKDAHILVILRDHVREKSKDERFSQFKNLEFVFLHQHIEDDKFLLYAALKSNKPGCYLITGDEMSNNFPKNEDGYIMSKWFLNQRINFTDVSSTLLRYPLKCPIKVQPITDDQSSAKRWFVPCTLKTKGSFQYFSLNELKRK